MHPLRALAARRLRRLGAGDQTTIIEHLDELRLRIAVTLATFAVALAVCLWQQRLLVHLVNAPLHGRRPVTFGVAEPFTATLTVAAYAAVILVLPFAVYQAYAYVLPALTPAERGVARWLLAAMPLLFACGAGFAYFVVLPAALRFLLHYNAHAFDIQLRARDWYGFFGMTMLAAGVVFQTPVAILAATRLGIVTPEALRRHRRVAIAVCAVVAAALPGVDPLSMLLEMLPLFALYEASVLLARRFRPRAPAVADDA